MTVVSERPQIVAAETFASLVHGWTARHGDATALTFLDHSGGSARAVSLTWRELDERIDAVAAHLLGIAAPKDRAAIVAPQSIEYVTAFLGAIRAGLVAVPLFGPGLPGHADRLAATLADCTPAVLLTTAAERDAIVAFQAGLTDVPVVAVDTLDAAPGPHDWPVPAPDDVAYLQYTSGSTRTPAGVMITHHNAVSNAHQAFEAYSNGMPGVSAISWLPLYHDMGLILGVGASLGAGGVPSVLMDPIAFLEQPVRWLRALAASPGAVTAAPNFAYAYSAARVSEDDRDRLDLSRVVSMINGAEPVLPATVAKFQAAFGPCGLRPEAHRSSYGLAEATVLVAVTDADAPPRQRAFDRDALAAGRAVPPVPGGTVSVLVTCGRAVRQEVRIVDPGTGTPLPDGQVGEIRVNGPNVGIGYWGLRQESVATFGDPADPDRLLATGDLGVLHDGELYVTGRIKDLVIVDGRNHYPQDVEQTCEAHPAVRPHSAAVFAVPGEDGEQAAALLELAKGVEFDPAAAGEVRAAVSREHGLALRDVVFVAPGSVPRTSSGKISRALSRAAFLADRCAGRRLA